MINGVIIVNLLLCINVSGYPLVALALEQLPERSSDAARREWAWVGQ